MELRKRMHDPIAKTGAWVEKMLNPRASDGHPGSAHLVPIALAERIC